MTIIRPSSKAILDQSSKLLALIWDKFFNDVQTALNNIQLNTGFTMAAAATKVVSDTRVTATSHIALEPTNQAGATLQAGANRLWISTRTAGVSFTVATTGGGSAVGTETFIYSVLG